MNFLDRALPLIERGFSLIPLQPNSKIPVKGLGAKQREGKRGFQQIESWAQRFPDANVGIVADERFCILESDDYARFSELLKRSTGAIIPETLTACGSSENRPHLFFLQPAQPQNLVMPGLFELRAVNQYVVGPGSVHPNGSVYRFLNDAPIAEMTPELLAGLKHLAGEHKRGMAAVNLSDEKFPEGTRHYALLSLAGRSWDGKKTTEQLFDELWQFNIERCDPPKAEVLVRGIATHYVNRMVPFDPGPTVVIGAPAPAPIRDGSSRHFDFVLSPPAGGTDGAFALGSVHIIYGTSGSGKSTLGLQMLQAQAKGEPFFGHASYGRSFLYLMKDRGKHEMVRTLTRMGAPDLPHATLPGGVNFTVAANAIRKAFFDAGQPEIVFVEGLDMCLDDPCDPAKVGNFMELLMSFADDYHVSVIGTVGAPKSKPGEEYSMRDGAFGSTFWARKCDIMVKVSQDFKTNLREVIVMYRNSMHEKFTFQFEAGRLVEAVVKDDEAPQSAYDAVLEFMRGRNWTTVVEVSRGVTISRQRTARILSEPAFEKSAALYPAHYRLRDSEGEIVASETALAIV